jgi:hypothetical protein
MMVLTGPEFAGAMDRLIQAPVERLSHQFQVGIREIAGIPKLLIKQPLGRVIVGKGRLQSAGQRRDTVTALAHQGQ